MIKAVMKKYTIFMLYKDFFLFVYILFDYEACKLYIYYSIKGSTTYQNIKPINKLQVFLWKYALFFWGLS